jgi:hypothetical protein
MPTGNYKYVIIDILGKTVISSDTRIATKEGSITIEINQLKKGRYILKLLNDKIEMEQNFIINK